jgi:hypothetical protein
VSALKVKSIESCEDVDFVIARICKCLYPLGIPAKVIVAVVADSVTVAKESYPLSGVNATGVVIELDAALGLDVPVAFVAVTVNVYAVCSDSPETVIGDVALVPVSPPGLDVAVNVVAP